MRTAIPTLFALMLPITLMIAPALSAEPAKYSLQPERSVVAFETDFGNNGVRITGKMPVTTADLTIDFDAVSRTTIDVELNVRKAVTSNPLATEAMTSPSVLSVREFPSIRFHSTSVRAKGDGAEVTGDLTIRGVTLPVILAAQIYRQKGTEAGDRRNLSVLLTGAVSRKAFGASGFPDMVGDEVRLKILARIERNG